MSEQNKIVTLSAVEPDVCEETVARLEQALIEAKRGEIRELFLLAKTHDGWREMATPTSDFSGWIGRLEITKSQWIANHRDTER